MPTAPLASDLAAQLRMARSTTSCFGKALYNKMLGILSFLVASNFGYQEQLSAF
jgi:hypothetical protein